MSTLRTVAPELKRARLGVALIFFTNGIVLGGFAPRIPEIRDSLELSYGGLGVAMAAWPVGSLLLGLGAAALIRRFRSSRVATFGMVLSTFAMLAAGLASSPLWFGVALFIVGATDAWVDVAQNSHGLRVQRRYKRSILNSFHALWSIGAVSGGLIGGIAAGIGLSVPWQFGLVSVLVVAVNIVAYPMLLKGPEPKHSGEEGADEAGVPHTADSPHTPLRRVPGRTWGLLAALSMIAIAGGWAEDAASTWSASYLRDELTAGATLAALGFVSMQGFQFIGRILGDRMVDRWGQRAVARWGGLLVAVGMGMALAFPSVWGTIAGFGLAGFGVATLIPGAMHAADELPGLRTGTGLTIVSWLLRLAFLLSPPLVGAIADATSLRVGLAIVPVMGMMVILLAGAMSPRKENPHGEHS
ncbi:MFS transporter [Demequina aurantiaca]|uniref:MFS transporter n=1 Tax=Demequina aurantiaca TaxID=676200 RepID=UPI0007811D2D|nr:MFS transporter [Demequina aurantiaca]